MRSAIVQKMYPCIHGKLRGREAEAWDKILVAVIRVLGWELQCQAGDSVDPLSANVENSYVGCHMSAWPTWAVHRRST